MPACTFPCATQLNALHFCTAQHLVLSQPSAKQLVSAPLGVAPGGIPAAPQPFPAVGLQSAHVFDVAQSVPLRPSLHSQQVVVLQPAVSQSWFVLSFLLLPQYIARAREFLLDARPP